MRFDLEEVQQELIKVLGTFAQDENFADQLTSAIQFGKNCSMKSERPP